MGALSYVDGVHATPHGPTDVAALGADFYATSAYKWSGPHVGAVVADPALLVDDVIELPVQVNGKVRARITVAADADAGAIEAAARSDDKVIAALGGATPKKVIVVPGRMVNLVV